MVAFTQQGVCAVMLGDSVNQLIEELQVCFSQSTIRQVKDKSSHYVDQIIALIEASSSVFDLPLDLHGTLFQQRVWQALKAIPVGNTITYSALAKSIGAPKAVRAVANACASNKLAIVIPCHRVVRSNATLAGYRWGIERKKILLEREKLSGHAMATDKNKTIGLDFH